MIRYAPGLGPLEIQGTGGVLNMEEFEMYFAFSMFFGFSQIPSSDSPPLGTLGWEYVAPEYKQHNYNQI